MYNAVIHKSKIIRETIENSKITKDHLTNHLKHSYKIYK